MKPCGKCGWMLKDTDARCAMCGEAAGPAGAPGPAAVAPPPPMAGAYAAQPPVAPPPVAAAGPALRPPMPVGYPAPGQAAPPPAVAHGGAFAAAPPAAVGPPAFSRGGAPAVGGGGLSPWAKAAPMAAPEPAPGMQSAPAPGLGYPASPPAPMGPQGSPYAAQAPAPAAPLQAVASPYGAPPVAVAPLPVAPPPMIPGTGGPPLPPPVVGGMPHPPYVPVGRPAPSPAAGQAAYGAAPVPPLVSPGSLDGPRPMMQPPGGPLGMTVTNVPDPVPIPDAGDAPVLIGFLVTFQNEPTGKFWPLRSGRTTLGRAGVDGPAEVALGDASTSARHALIQGDPATGQAFIEDAGSRNGTFINEQKLMPSSQRQLHDNDRLRLGSITLVVKLLAAG